MKKFIFCVLFVLVSLSMFAQNLETRNYKLGDTGPAGGIVFYIDGSKYYECSDNLGTCSWKGARVRCRNYRKGGYCDWRLPKKDELNWMCQYFRERGILEKDDSGWGKDYWSATTCEFSGEHAYIQAFKDGSSIGWEKVHPSYIYVRAVRTFTIK